MAQKPERGGAVLQYSGCLRHLGPGACGGSRHPETGPTRSRCKQTPVHCSRPYGFQLRSHGTYSGRPHRSHARLPRRSSCAAVHVLEFAFSGGSVSHFRSEDRLKKMGEVADLFDAVSATSFDFSGTLPGSCMGKARASNNGIRSYEFDKWSLRYRYGRPDVSDPCHRI